MTTVATGTPTLPGVASIAVRESTAEPLPGPAKKGATLACSSVTVSTPLPLAPVTESVAVKVTR